MARSIEVLVSLECPTSLDVFPLGDESPIRPMQGCAMSERPFMGNHATTLRNVLEGYERNAKGLRKPTAGDVAQGSRASAECEQGEAFSGPWGANPLMEALLGSGLRNAVAMQQMGAVARLLFQHPPHLLGAEPVARSLIETSARAWRILDLDMEPRERLACHLNEKIERLWFTDGGRDTVDAFLREAESYEFNTRKRGRRPPYVGDEEPPSATQMIRDLMDAGTGDLGGALQDRYSGTVHGTVGHLIDHFGPGPDGAGVLQVRSDDVIRTAASCVVAVGEAMTRQVALFGWDGHAWVSWHLHALSVVGAYLPHSSQGA